VPPSMKTIDTAALIQEVRSLVEFKHNLEKYVL
jgi:hypothetical protein